MNELASPGLLLALLAGVAIAWNNGANDVSKGVATLVGTGVTNLKRATTWGTAWTAAGALAGALVARAMLDTFGSALLTDLAAPALSSAVSTMLGAAAWLALATRLGLPVSTTHALVGAIMGTALVAWGPRSLQWNTLVYKVAMPLAFSPLVALALTIAVVKGWTRLVPARANRSVSTVNRLHWLTAGFTSFARGLNDAPKLVALTVTATVLAAPGLAVPGQAPAAAIFALLALSMAMGGLFAGRRVTRVMASDITTLKHGEGFAANLVSSILVGAGAVLGLPMSTTHVASCAVIGTGATRSGALQMKTVGTIAAAWIVTLPAAAGMAAAFWYAAKLAGPAAAVAGVTP